MVAKRQIIEVAVNLVNVFATILYGIAAVTWITGMDITQIITMPPIDLGEIVRQYPGVFHALCIGLLAILAIDQVAVGIVFRRRGIPPPGYIFASSLATFSISTVLFIFLRATPLWPYYLYFMIISALALIHSAAILMGRMKEIVPEAPRPQAIILDDFSYGTWTSESIYPEPYGARRRRVLRECQLC